MPETELTQRIEAHQSVIAELNTISPEVEAYQMRISQFILNNPGLAGLSYSAAEILMKEKDLTVMYKAIDIIKEELRMRRDPNSPGYRLIHRIITDSQVRKIILKCRPQTEIKKPDSKSTQIPVELVCPHCKADIQYGPVKRNEIISFRGTEITDDAIEYLSLKLCVSRSLLVNVLLSAEHKYGHGLKT